MVLIVSAYSFIVWPKCDAQAFKNSSNWSKFNCIEIEFLLMEVKLNMSSITSPNKTPLSKSIIKDIKTSQKRQKNSEIGEGKRDLWGYKLEEQ